MVVVVVQPQRSTYITSVTTCVFDPPRLPTFAFGNGEPLRAALPCKTSTWGATQPKHLSKPKTSERDMLKLITPLRPYTSCFVHCVRQKVHCSHRSSEVKLVRKQMELDIQREIFHMCAGFFSMHDAAVIQESQQSRHSNIYLKRTPQFSPRDSLLHRF